MAKNILAVLVLIAFVAYIPFALFYALKTAALLDLRSQGISVQEKGDWMKFSNQAMWCRPAPEFSKHAEICQEQEP